MVRHLQCIPLSLNKDLLLKKMTINVRKNMAVDAAKIVFPCSDLKRASF